MAELWELRTWSERQFVVIGHGLFAISLGGLAGLFAALVHERRVKLLPRFSLKQLLFVAIFVCLGAQAVNRHDLIWATLINTLAARSGGFHFEYDEAAADWIGTRGGESFRPFVVDTMREQGGIDLVW